MDFSILYFLQECRSEFWDAAMAVITVSMGRGGISWIAASCVLMCFDRTRRCGAAVLMAYAMACLIGHFGLKELIARARPCHVDGAVSLIEQCPKSFSCPSSHACMAFAGAAAVFSYHKKIGAALLAFAAAVGFSRMYLFVHFPTDVLFGAVLGIVFGFFAAKIANACRFGNHSR